MNLFMILFIWRRGCALCQCSEYLQLVKRFACYDSLTRHSKHPERTGESCDTNISGIVICVKQRRHLRERPVQQWKNCVLFQNSFCSKYNTLKKHNIQINAQDGVRASNYESVSMGLLNVNLQYVENVKLMAFLLSIVATETSAFLMQNASNQKYIV